MQLDHTPLLEATHHMLTASQIVVKTLKGVANSTVPLRPETQQLLCATSVSVLELQARMIRTLVEENLIMADELENVINVLSKK